MDIPRCVQGIDCGDLATWLSSIASFAAVVVALYLARRQDKPTAKGSLGIVFITPDIERNLLCYQVTNLGTHPLRVSSAFLEVHPLARRFIKWPSAIANNWQHYMNSRLPADLQRGESFLYATEAEGAPFAELLSEFPAPAWVVSRIIRAGVTTPWGSIYLKIDKNVRARFEEEIQKHRSLKEKSNGKTAKQAHPVTPPNSDAAPDAISNATSRHRAGPRRDEGDTEPGRRHGTENEVSSTGKKLSEIDRAKNDATGKASDVGRQLAFAGIATVWLLRDEGARPIGNFLLIALTLLVLALLLDFLQYVVCGAIWRNFYNKHFDEHKNDDACVDVPDELARPIYRFYWWKIRLLASGYVFLLIGAIIKLKLF